jgi:hypothetical protein
MVVTLIAIVFCILCGSAQGAKNVRRCPHPDFVNKNICQNCNNVATAERHVVGSLWKTDLEKQFYSKPLKSYSDISGTCGANFQKYECNRFNWNCTIGNNYKAVHNRNTGHLYPKSFAAASSTIKSRYCPNGYFLAKRIFSVLKIFI